LSPADYVGSAGFSAVMMTGALMGHRPCPASPRRRPPAAARPRTPQLAINARLGVTLGAHPAGFRAGDGRCCSVSRPKADRSRRSTGHSTPGLASRSIRFGCQRSSGSLRSPGSASELGDCAAMSSRQTITSISTPSTADRGRFCEGLFGQVSPSQSPG